MSQLYVIVKNASDIVVGKNIYAGNTQDALDTAIANYPLLTFTVVDQTTFDSTPFVGPNYLLG